MTHQPRPLLAITVFDDGDHWTVEQTMLTDLPMDEACGVTQLAMDTAERMHNAVHVLHGMRN